MSKSDQDYAVSTLGDLNAIDLYAVVKFVLDCAEDADPKPSTPEEWTIYIAQLIEAWQENRP